jgi:DNA ligase 1
LQLSTLYKKTNTGAIQYWQINVQNHPVLGESHIIIEYGQVGTDSPQTTIDSIKEGKNIGKTNETTRFEQAESEALAKWTKQKKKGYVESLEAAQNEELDELIEGGTEPMLAHRFMDVIWDLRPGHDNTKPQYVKTKDAKKIKMPAFSQPKLDGIRATSEGPDRSLWSRTRKRINSVPHIVKELSMLFEGVEYPSDGELYNHDFKNEFEKIVSIVRKDEPEEGYLNVQYHMYDIVMPGTFAERIAFIYNLVEKYEKLHGPLQYIKLVHTRNVETEEQLMDSFFEFRKMGYEGAMVRNANSPYVYKRSYDLQKLKEFQDDEFEIVSIKEGRGKLNGHVGAFNCRMKNGKEFEVKLEGDTAQLKIYFENESLWKGKLLTVRYQGFTFAEGKPRFPVGKAIRDYE